MAQYHYPELANHSLHHAFCMARFDQIGYSLLDGRAEPDRRFLDDLFDMLLDDVIRADGGFKSYLGTEVVSIRAAG